MSYIESDKKRFLDIIKSNEDKINHSVPIDWRLQMDSQRNVHQNYETYFNNDVHFRKNAYFEKKGYFESGGLVVDGLVVSGGVSADVINFDKSILKVDPSTEYTTGTPTDVERIDAMTLKCKEILHIRNNDYYNWDDDITYNGENFSKDWVILDNNEIESDSSGAGTLIFIKNNSYTTKYIMGANNNAIEIGNGVALIMTLQYNEDEDEYYVETFSRSFCTDYDTLSII